MKISTNYKTKENYNELIKYIKDFINNNKEVIIINIGTDRCTGDSLAPLIGTILKENKCPLKVYGDLENPIHALNLNKKLLKIKDIHPNAKIIGIDASLGDIQDIGNIILRNRPIYPGKGVGKKLDSVGDISIVGVVDDSEINLLFTERSIRLSFVYRLSMLISDIILTACDLSTKNIKLYHQNIYELNKRKVQKEIAIN